MYYEWQNINENKNKNVAITIQHFYHYDMKTGGQQCRSKSFSQSKYGN
jgi:hypothetical protein